MVKAAMLVVFAFCRVGAFCGVGRTLACRASSRILPQFALRGM